MAQVPLTLRLEASLRETLEVVSKLTRTSMNQLINDAVHQYLADLSPHLVQDLEAKLRQLQSQASVDRDSSEAIRRFAVAEVGVADPFEAEIFEAVPLTASQREFRELLLND